MRLRLAFLCAATAFAQQSDPFPTLTSTIESTMRQRHIPGLAIGIVQNDKLVYSRGFGVMKTGDASRPVTPETLFHMASITKPFIATAVMQLWEEGRIDLDAPVEKYVSYFRLNDARYHSITVRQMLSHISGMPDVDDYRWNHPEYDESALERYVRSLSFQKLRRDPGTKFAYSNMAYDVLGDLVAKVSGQVLETYMDTHILKPIGMVSSTLLYRQADPALLAAGHHVKGKKTTVVQFYPYNRAHTPSGNLHSNVGDMSRWAMANINRGELDGARILKDSTYEVMWKPAAELASQVHVGISWFLRDLRGTKAVFHSGGDDGFLTLLILFPEKKTAVVWMVNCDNSAGLSGIHDAAVAAALN
ncbi:MAG TPA: serine hydrolase domain-containing protein [Bryobacteraceae bacterium]|nr:serine hydrolase domain-containing protein [Bryobacteraceae bacterium]